MKRIVLFLITNLAVILVLSIVLNIVFSVLGVDRSGIGGLLVFAAVFGFGGSFISLAMSKWMAKRSTGAVVITQPQNATEHWLFDTVRRQAQQAGIGMPEVAIYDSPEMNAFATGMSRNNALVAVSTGLLRNMREDEVEAVLALKPQRLTDVSKRLEAVRAFAALREKGQGDEVIAAAFFVTPQVVRQRLKLASVAPALLEVYAEDSTNHSAFDPASIMLYFFPAAWTTNSVGTEANGLRSLAHIRACATRPSSHLHCCELAGTLPRQTSNVRCHEGLRTGHRSHRHSERGFPPGALHRQKLPARRHGLEAE